MADVILTTILGNIDDLHGSIYTVSGGRQVCPLDTYLQGYNTKGLSVDY
jgi:hypothetical protein